MDFPGTADRAARQALAEISSASPLLFQRLEDWLGKLAALDNPAAYFTAPLSLPILALPWWIEQSIRGAVDSGFQLDLMLSSINGYYFTRMLDDMMDGHPIDRSILPALYPFHLRFTRPYSRRFEPQSTFWGHFDRILMVTVEAASVEAALASIAAPDFLHVSARKAAAALIPLAAVCVRYDRLDLLPAWEAMFASFAKWHQMRDDLLDWSADQKSGQPTWLLCEADLRRDAGESIPAWMARQGLSWTKAVMAEWMTEALSAAEPLNSPELLLYLRERDRQFSRQIDTMIAQAAAYRQLLDLDSLTSTKS